MAREKISEFVFIMSFSEYAQLAPQLFAVYIPNILPPMCEDDIQKHVYEIRHIQEKLAKEGYSRTSSPLKRPLDSETPREPSNSST